MPVQNFLEDEDYDQDSVEAAGVSSVPNFLQDEEYEDTGDGEYYGGGFTDGATGFDGGTGFGGDATEDFDGYEDDEDELFDGAEVFDGEDAADDTDPSGGTTLAETSSYGITGLGSRVAPTPPVSSVPDFLREDEDEVPVARNPVATPVVAESRTVAPAEEPRVRERRDLSKRPPRAEISNPNATADSVASTSSTPTDSTSPVRNPRGGIPTADPRFVPDATPVAGATDPTPTAAGTDGPTGSAVSTVRFDPKAGVDPLSEDEIDELKAPSSYAANRELKFTALKQADSTVRRVGTDGLTDAERKRGARANPTPVRTPSNGRLSQEELLFYANFGATHASDFGGASKKQLFLPPVLKENPTQKKEREARINRALSGGSIAQGAKSRLTEKDYRVLQFMALFKFVSERQIGKLLQCAEITAYKRLNELRKHGLTKGFKTLGVKGSVWVLTETGMDLSGFDLPRGTEAALTLSMVSHQFTVNHVAAHLWAGGANVLREKNFPQRNLPNGKGELEFGEQIISELQIQSAFGKVRGSNRADAFVPQVKKHLAGQFDDWQRAGGTSFGPSPELQRGNEYMWTLFPPVSNRLNYHVPDLVVARPRTADGKPQSIAVEIELRTKADDTSYERTLDAYRVDDSIYRKVVWVCRLKGTAEKLARIAKSNGLADQGRIEIVPIYMSDGSRFTGKDTWSL